MSNGSGLLYCAVVTVSNGSGLLYSAVVTVSDEKDPLLSAVVTVAKEKSWVVSVMIKEVAFRRNAVRTRCMYQTTDCLPCPGAVLQLLLLLLLRPDVRQADAPEGWEVYAPPLPVSFGTHHSKAFVIGRRNSVTVAIHTANLIRIDWHNKTQAVWCQTFPVKQRKSLADTVAEGAGDPGSIGGTGVNGGAGGAERLTRQERPGVSTPSDLGEGRGQGGGAGAPGAAGEPPGCQGPAFEECLVRYFSSLGWRGCTVPVPPQNQEQKGTPGQEQRGTLRALDKAHTIWLNAAYLRKYDYSAATVRELSRPLHCPPPRPCSRWLGFLCAMRVAQLHALMHSCAHALMHSCTHFLTCSRADAQFHARMHSCMICKTGLR